MKTRVKVESQTRLATDVDAALEQMDNFQVCQVVVVFVVVVLVVIVVVVVVVVNLLLFFFCCGCECGCECNKTSITLETNMQIFTHSLGRCCKH